MRGSNGGPAPPLRAGPGWRAASATAGLWWPEVPTATLARPWWLGGPVPMLEKSVDRAPVLGCAIAGVKSIDWFIGYMRADLSDKIRASLAIGSF